MKNEKLDQNKEHNSQKHLNQYKLQGMTNKAYRPSLSLANWEVYCMSDVLKQFSTKLLWKLPNCTGWPKKPSHYQISISRINPIKACKLD